MQPPSHQSSRTSWLTWTLQPSNRSSSKQPLSTVLPPLTAATAHPAVVMLVVLAPTVVPHHSLWGELPAVYASLQLCQR